MNLNDLFNLIFPLNPLLFLKILILILLGFYIIFAFVVVRQEELMAKTIEAPISPALKVLTFIHFLGAVLLFLLALLIL